MMKRRYIISNLAIISLLLFLSPIKAQGAPISQSKPLFNPAVTPLGLGNGLFATYFNLGDPELIGWIDGEGPINHGWTSGCEEFYNHTMYQNECGYWQGDWNSTGQFEEVLTGYIEAPQTGNYEFHASIDDYLEITINGISDLVDGPGAYSIQTYLVQGHFYPITMHFMNREGTNNLALFWTLPDLNFVMVPKAYLYTKIPVLGTGNGLFAQYYALGGSEVLKTVDGEGPVNHGWNSSCSGTSFTFYQNVCGLWAGTWIGSDTLEEALVGYIEAPATGHYIFHAGIDDYLDITINGINQIVNGVGGYSIETDLIQGYFYPIRMHYKNTTGTGDLALWWESSTIPFSVVPRMYLYTENPYLPADFGKTSPADESTGMLLNPTLTWSPAEGAVQYEYCYYSTEASDCEGTWPSTGLNAIALSGLVPDTTYHWQVRATNEVGAKDSDGGDWWSFTTQVAPPESFTKSIPANGALDVSLSPLLSWTVSTHAVSYSYCIDQIAGSTCEDAWHPLSDLSVQLSDLDPDTVYYWQVRASNTTDSVDADGGAWWSFTTTPLKAYIPMVINP